MCTKPSGQVVAVPLIHKPDDLLVFVQIHDNYRLNCLYKIINIEEWEINKIPTFCRLNKGVVYVCVCENTRRFGLCVEDMTREEVVSEWENSFG